MDPDPSSPHPSCVPLTPEIPLGTQGWHHEDAARGGGHQPPLFLQSPSSLGSFWDETSAGLPASRRAASLHERERLQGFLFQLGCFGFPGVLKHRPSLWLSEPFACMKCPFSWDGGELGRNPIFPGRAVMLSLCHVLYFGDMRRNSALSLAGWQEDVVNRRMSPSFWLYQKGEVPLTGVTGECCDWSW